MKYTATPTSFEIFADDDPQELAAKIDMQDEVASCIEIRTCVNPDNWPGLSDTILAALLQMHPQGGGEMTPTEIEALYPPEIVEAWHWINVKCPHYATHGRDWQTTDNMSAADKITAELHMATLRDAGLIDIESAPPRGNFVKKPL